MPDKATKILLGVIALGLWANIAVSMFRPITAVAQSLELTKIQRDVSDLALPALSPTNFYQATVGKGYALVPGAPYSFTATLTTAAQEVQGGILQVIKNSTETTGGSGITGPVAAIYGETDVADTTSGAGNGFWNQTGVTGIVVNNNHHNSQPTGAAGAIGLSGFGYSPSALATATWGANINLIENYTAGVPTNLQYGLEVTYTASGADTNAQRTGVLFTANKYMGGTTPLLTHLLTLGSVAAQATYTNVVDLIPGTTAVSGLNFHGGTFTTSVVQLPNGVNDLAFENASSVFTAGAAGSAFFKANTNNQYFDNYDNSIFIFRGVGAAQLAQIGGTPGAATKYICSDAAGVWFAQAAAC